MPKVGVAIGICVSLMLNACSRASESRIPIELHDTPAASEPKKSGGENILLVCPPGDPPGNDASSSPRGGHNVTLSWRASLSTRQPYAKEVRYCLYRSEGRPVQSSHSGTVGKSPCVNCQRVTLTPVAGTLYKDTQVKSKTHYCYVALALESGNNAPSAFSNQADAVIPPRKESPFCNGRGRNMKTRSAAMQRRLSGAKP